MSHGSLARHTAIYAIAPVVQRLLALVLVNAYTSRFSPGEWGVLSQCDLLLGLLPLLLGTSLLAGLARHYFQHPEGPERRSVISGTALALLGLTAVGTAAALAARRPLAQLLFGGDGLPVADSYVRIVALCVLVVPFAIGAGIGMELLQAEKRSLTVTRIEVTKTLLDAALKLSFVFGLGWGVEGFLLGVLLSQAAVGVPLLVWTFRSVGLRVDWRTLAPVLRYALPLVPVGLFQLGLHQADKLLLEHLGPSTLVPSSDPTAPPMSLAKAWLGLYGLGYMIPFVFHSAVLASFNRIWAPTAFAMAAGPERARELRRVGDAVVALFGLAYAGVALFGREAVLLLAGQDGYADAALVVPIVAAAYFVYALYSLGQTVLFTARVPHVLTWLCGGALVVNVLANVALIPWFGERGYLGAAFATLAAFVVLALGCHAAARRHLGAPYSLGRAALTLSGVGATALVAVALDSADIPHAGVIAAKLAWAVGLAALVWARLLTPELRAAFRGALRR